MVNTTSVVLDKPIVSVRVFGEAENEQIGQAASEQAKAMLNEEMQKIEDEKRRISQLISAIETAALEIDELRKQAITENQKQIALLAVSIAKKILLSEIDEGKYDIEAMIETALRTAPSREGARVRLNPADHAKIEEIIKTDNSNFENIIFEADSSIMPAQCFVSTSKGVVEYFIEDQLNSIGDMLGSESHLQTD